MGICGLSLGLVTSVKLVGLFSVALIGINTIADLIQLAFQRRISMQKYLYHWIARIVLLIVLPLAVYIATFYVHLRVLYKPGPGDWILEPTFLANRYGYVFHHAPLGNSHATFLILIRA